MENCVIYVSLWMALKISECATDNGISVKSIKLMLIRWNYFSEEGFQNKSQTQTATTYCTKQERQQRPHEMLTL